MLVGNSTFLTHLKEMLKTVVATFRRERDPVILIRGEKGSGKKTIGRYIHSLLGSNEPVVVLHCAQVSNELLENTLFALSPEGTLYLDEVSSLDLKMQARLLSILQTRTVRRTEGVLELPVRAQIIAATQKDLTRLIEEKKFREDLYYALNAMPISVPPLRSRPEDIRDLSQFFLAQLAEENAKQFSDFSEKAIFSINAYRWPGNIAEMKNVIERAVILENGPVLELSRFRQELLRSEQFGDLTKANQSSSSSPNAPESATDSMVVHFPAAYEKGLASFRKDTDDKLVREVLIKALEINQGNVSAAARSLRLDRANMLRLMKRFHIYSDLFRLNQAS